jgi:rod shape determining protein RodA
MGSIRYVVMQLLAAGIGVVLYIVISSIDVEFFSEHRRVLVIFNFLVLLMLIPFGVRVNGNRSWISFPFLPFNIQVAEICKITYILIMASVMSSHQNKLSSVPSVIHMAFHLLVLVGLNLVLSDDAGVSLIFVFIFVGMAFSGGVKLIWFAVGGGAVVAAWPVFWDKFMDNHQKLRIQSLFDPSIDPSGIGVRYHLKRSLDTLTGGGMTGQGLFNGNRTQVGALPAQHTDFIFSAIGEEMGFVGCALVLVLMGLIVGRCIWVGFRSQDIMRRLVCFGAASALIFQVTINVGMCIGVMPVIGLTLPFISYGGSSIVTLYALLGLVSGVCARPEPPAHQRYIRPYRN